MPEVRRERISGVDTAWLRMDLPTNLMVIVGVLMFEGRLDVKQVKRTLERRFLAFRRFRQRAVQDPTGAWWEDDRRLRHRLARPPGGAAGQGRQGRAAGLRERPRLHAARLLQAPLAVPPRRQLRRRQRAGDAHPPLLRRRHRAGAGDALDDREDGAGEPRAAGRALRRRNAAARRTSGSRSCRPVDRAPSRAPRASAAASSTRAARLAANPAAAQEALEGVTRKGMDFAGELARLALMGSDSPTRFKGRLGARKRVAWADAVAARRSEGDGQGARLLHQRRPARDGHRGAARLPRRPRATRSTASGIRAIVPVNLRPATAAAGSSATASGSCSSTCPSGSTIRSSGSTRCGARCRPSRAPTSPSSSWGCCTPWATGPKILQEQVTALLSQNASAVMTNVPGPAASDLLRRPAHRGARLLGAAVGRHRHGRVDPLLQRAHPVRRSSRTRASSPTRTASSTGSTGEFDKLMWLTLMSPWGDEGVEPAAPTPATPASAPARPVKAAQGQAGNGCRAGQGPQAPSRALVPAAERKRAGLRRPVSLSAAGASRPRTRYFRCFETSLVISNIETVFLPPKTSRSLSSALMLRRLTLSCRLFFLM